MGGDVIIRRRQFAAKMRGRLGVRPDGLCKVGRAEGGEVRRLTAKGGVKAAFYINAKPYKSRDNYKWGGRGCAISYSYNSLRAAQLC